MHSSFSETWATLDSGRSALEVMFGVIIDSSWRTWLLHLILVSARTLGPAVKKLWNPGRARSGKIRTQVTRIKTVKVNKSNHRHKRSCQYTVAMVISTDMGFTCGKKVFTWNRTFESVRGRPWRSEGQNSLAGTFFVLEDIQDIPKVSSLLDLWYTQKNSLAKTRM